MKTDFLAIHERIKDSIHHAISDEAEDWSIMPSDIAKEIDNGFLVYAEGLEEQCELLQTEQTAFVQTQTEVLNSHVMNEHLHLTSFQTEAIDKVPQKLDRTDFEAHLQDDARHLTFSDKDTLSQVSQKLDREEFEKHAGNYSAHLSHWQSQQIEDSFKFRNIVASVSEATEAGTYLVQSTAADLPEGLEEIEGYHELRVYSYDSDRKPEKKPFRSEEAEEIETPEPEITEPETEPKNYHILVQSLDILKNDSYQNYIRLAYLEKTQKPMVEEDLAETEMPAYTFSTWKKQVAVGAEGFEDLVESVLGVESKYNAHEKNTQIHTSQAEKDAWNGKAVIKGLESGKVQMKPNNFDANSLVENSIFYFRVIDVSLSNMPNIGYWRLEHYMQGDVYFQKATLDYFCNEYVRYKYKHDDTAWTPWKLIAQDQEPINTHLADANSATPVKHTTQTEKNTWNGKATIKGLESGFVEMNPTIADNANNINYNSIYYVFTESKIGYPVNNSYGYLETLIRTDKAGLLQTFRNFLTNTIFQRIENNGWQPWKLIAQDQEGVAKIKGLESVNGVEEKLNTWNGFNELKTSEYLIVGGNPNAPNPQWGVLKTRTNGSHAGYQEYRTLDGYVYNRYFGSARWGTWKLIAQPQTALTNRIEELEEKIEQLETTLRKTKL